MSTWFDGFQRIMAMVGAGVDAIGVLIILGGAFVSVYLLFAVNWSKGGNLYLLFRQDLGKSILLGLEFLIAGDIIRTVVVDTTLVNVLILGLIVLIRTFLSMALQLEIEGRWPWQPPRKAGQ